MYGWDIITKDDKYEVKNFDSLQGVTYWIKYDS